MPAESALQLAASSGAPNLHHVWYADQMGAYQASTTATGYDVLNDELPHGGWPASVLIELLLQQHGIGEMRLLRPALSAIAQAQRIALIEPPHAPHITACAAWGIAPERLLWIKTERERDALWSAEQILRNGSCGALLCWQTRIHPEALRRLHLAAQAANTMFWMLRPLSAAPQPSPAPLRLGLMPMRGGIRIRMIKRRGPLRKDSFDLRFADMATFPFNASTISHAAVDRRTPALAAARSHPPELVEARHACSVEP